jgi:hypothetical protein
MHAKAVLGGAEQALTSGPSGRLYQLVLYTISPQRLRSSRATMSIRLTWPPWELNSTSFLTPARATLSPSSVHSAMTVGATA